MRWKHPAAYLEHSAAGQPVQEMQDVAVADLPFEFLMNALRLADGFAPALFEARTAQPISRILTELRAAEVDGLLDVSVEQIRPTLRGRRFLNVLLERFLAKD
jgi:oxygen-independent coproporphyrinogen-3 oxidase